MSSRVLLLPFLLAAALWLQGALQTGTGAIPHQDPAIHKIQGRVFILGNHTLKASWKLEKGGLRPTTLLGTDGKPLPVPAELFTLTLEGRPSLPASAMILQAPPVFRKLEAHRQASSLAERIPGWCLEAVFQDREGTLRATWKAILRDGSRYLRQAVSLSSLRGDLPLRVITLPELDLPGAAVSGEVHGSPVVAGTLFLGLEHPMSESSVKDGHIRCILSRNVPLSPGQNLEVSWVMGLTAPGQMRRDFLAYLERERAHPYRTFLHYNTWYDIGYFSKFDEKACLDTITLFGSQLTEKRGVHLDSILMDDGWDDPATLWQFHSGFPNGFGPVHKALHAYGITPGVWLSPWGGYGKPREERLRLGKAQGFEMNEEGFSLSGPIYYRRFHDTCLRMVRDFGVGHFKFDGIGEASGHTPGSPFGSDFDAAIALISDLRHERPDIYINLTTGTWPSPFWLQHADSIWRGGEDHGFEGVGSDRQRWITYRDADTYAGIVKKGPLYPLNSLMLHGIIYARHARKLDSDPGGDLRSEIHDFFGSGTQLQELYITPSLLKDSDWEDLAETARWSRERAGILVDTHWVGGDPARLEVYGWASWSPGQGVLVLRNPSDHPATFPVDPAVLLELPAGSPTRWTGKSPWKSDAGRPAQTFTSGHPVPVTLAPFEVLTLDLVPAH